MTKHVARLLTVTALLAPVASAQEETCASLYWTDAGDHSLGIKDLSTGSAAELLDGLSTPIHLAFDSTHDKLYWISDGDDSIRRANADGTQVETLYAALSEPRGLALDVAAGTLYWSDRTDDVLRRAPMDGGGPVEDLIEHGDGGVSIVIPHSVALDLQRGRLYWLDASTLSINSAQLDGSDVRTEITSLPGPLRGLAIDSAGGKAYWVSWKKLQRADLDTWVPEDLLDMTPYNEPSEVALDLPNGDVYWTAKEEIWRAAVDGTAPTLVQDSLNNAHGLAFDYAHEASAVFRTDAAGLNLTGYIAEPPIVGGEFVASVDNTGTGDVLAFVLGFATPLDLVIPGLESLLVNVGDPLGELLGLAIAAGSGLVTFTAPVPSKPALCGFSFSTQGFSVGLDTGIRAHNAYDLTIGL